MTTATPPRSQPTDTVLTPDPSDQDDAVTIGGFLAGRQGAPLVLQGDDGAAVPLSPFFVDMLTRMTKLLARGQSVRLRPYRATMTTTEAAELLGMSRTHLRQLIDRGELRAFAVGTHHRLEAQDVVQYRRRQRAEFRSAMREIAESGDDWPSD